MAKKFKEIYLEISSICNGKCPYCITGRSKKSASNVSFISPKLFSDILEKLYTDAYADEQSTIHLYVWGEPFLHPEFTTLLEIANRFPMGIAISTNASIVPKITRHFVNKVSSVRFSCSGYTQDSYDKIHQFNVETIRKNITTLVTNARALGSKANFDINFHVYQFNQGDYFNVKEFADNLSISISANYAILNDWNLTKQWIQKKLTVDKCITIGSELFNFIPYKLLMDTPSAYSCPQNAYLVLNTQGNICICCQTPHEENFYVGNFMDSNADKILDQRQSGEVCAECLQLKMAYIFNNSLVTPPWVLNKKNTGLILRAINKLKGIF